MATRPKPKRPNVASYTHCKQCPHHRIINDRDPEDWFNDDDCAVTCTLVPNPQPEPSSKYLSDRCEHRVVAAACRPYEAENVRVPDWCPLIK